MAFVKSNPDNVRFNLSDILTHKDEYNVLSVYGPNETTVFVKASNPNLDVSYICDAVGNKWVLSNRNLKPINRNESSVEPNESVLSKEAIQDEKDLAALLNSIDHSKFDKLFEGKKTEPKLQAMAFDWISLYSDVSENELYALLKEIGKQTMLWLTDKPSEQAIRIMLSCLSELPKQAQTMSGVNYCATIKFVYGFTVVLYKDSFPGKLYIHYPNGVTKEEYKIPSGVKPLTKEQAQEAAADFENIFKSTKADTIVSKTPTIIDTRTMNTDYFKAALKADEQFSIDSNKKYAKFDYEKGLLLNSKLIKDETFKQYNEPVQPFSIDLFDTLTTYVPVVSPVWYKEFARAGFCNADDVNSFVNFDANRNPWFIIQTPKVWVGNAQIKGQVKTEVIKSEPSVQKEVTMSDTNKPIYLEVIDPKGTITLFNRDGGLGMLMATRSQHYSNSALKTAYVIGGLTEAFRLHKTNHSTSPTFDVFGKVELTVFIQAILNNIDKPVDEAWDAAIMAVNVYKKPEVLKETESVLLRCVNTIYDLTSNTISARFALIADTSEVYQKYNMLEYNEYTLGEYAKGKWVDCILDKTDQIWVNISK